jgi:RNA polymerase sigma-70 factor (ECF subfamily)
LAPADFERRITVAHEESLEPKRGLPRRLAMESPSVESLPLIAPAVWGAGDGALARSRAAFIDAALAHVEELAAFTRRLTGSRWEGDDLLQETYARALSRAEELRDLGACRAWLFRIARNLHLDKLKSADRRRLQLVADGAPESASPADPTRELRPDLERGLATLPPEQRDALLLCDVWGFKYAEIAEITECALGTVRSRIARARGALLSALGGSAKRGNR